MNNHFKVAVVGGGASGLFAAAGLVFRGFSGSDILVLERNDRVGKKLLATGNGLGNLTNVNMGKEFYHGNADIISAFTEGLKDFDLKARFYFLGIPLVSDEEGRVYPASKQAGAVLDALRGYLSKNGVIVVTGAKVIKIRKERGEFALCAEDGAYYSEKVVLAFGGASGRGFGTDGSSYVLAESFGHNKTPLFPSLVQIKTETDRIRPLKGVKTDAIVTVSDGEKRIKTEKGDLLFTDYGVSGSAVFKASGYLAGLNDPYVIIEFLPDFSEKEIERIISDKMRLDFIEREEILSGLTNRIIGRTVYKYSSDKSPKSLAHALKNFKLKVTGNTGFNNAQVTKGGIDGKGINPETFESKYSDGLYIVGEALDVDGDCGGYNLTFAFYSGDKAAEDIIKKASKR